MTIDTRLAEIRARVDAATEGPWEWIDGALHPAPELRDEYGISALIGWDPIYDVPALDPSNAEFIAASRTDLPTLLAAVEAVRALHQPEWHCGNPRHTNPDAGCPECAECCTADGEECPCPTIIALTAPLEVEA